MDPNPPILLPLVNTTNDGTIIQTAKYKGLISLDLNDNVTQASVVTLGQGYNSLKPELLAAILSGSFLFLPLLLSVEQPTHINALLKMRIYLHIYSHPHTGHRKASMYEETIQCPQMF